MHITYWISVHKLLVFVIRLFSYEYCILIFVLLCKIMIIWSFRFKSKRVTNNKLNKS